MQVSLNHRFKTYCPNPDGLFSKMKDEEGTFIPKKCSIENYMKRVIEQADNPTNKLNWGEMYVGDGFEVFTEALIKLMGYHPHIGITEYVPHPKRDMGVDGAGKGLDGKPATVQVKHRADPRHLLVGGGDDRLDSYFGESVSTFKVSIEGHRNLLVVTTGSDIHPVIREKYPQMRCIGREQINDLTKGNVAFWSKFNDMMTYKV